MTDPADRPSAPQLPPMVLNAVQIATGAGRGPDGRAVATINLANAIGCATIALDPAALDQVIAGLQEIRGKIAAADLVVASGVPMRAHEAELAARAERANGAGRGY